MPERVLGILDDPQRVLEIFLGKKSTERLVGYFDSFIECPQRIVDTPTYQQHTNNIQTTFQQHTNNTPTYQ